MENGNNKDSSAGELRHPEEASTQTLDRLRKERYEREQKHFSTGTNDGEAWAQDASYDNLIHVLQVAVQPNVCESDFGDGDIEEVFDGPRTALSPSDYRAYFCGWLTGVSIFWRRLKDRL